MTDNRMTELREKLTEHGVKHEDSELTDFNDGTTTYYTEWGGNDDGDGANVYVEYVDGTVLRMFDATPEQAIAATLGRPKAKAHPWGYEPDTGAFDVTRCECGCLNDISATYCNDCGGVIEVDMNAEKEIYRTPRNSVFAVKHDDGSLEFGGKRYVAATLGSGRLTAKQVSRAVYEHSIHADCADADWQAIADELNARYRCGLTDEDYNILLDELGVSERTCRIDSTLLIEGEYVPSPYYEYEMECGGGFCWDDSEPPTYCPNCGSRVVE